MEIGNLEKVLRVGEGRRLKRLQEQAAYITSLEPDFEQLSAADLQGKTADFRQRLENGETIDELVFEAFAAVREARKRASGQRMFDVQLMGGIVLHEGDIAEMKTGEGKTFVASLALYLNGLAGRGAHLITVNDYLAQRDAEWNRPVFESLGMSVSYIETMMPFDARKAAYAADITYGTNSEFGFDYLRDNMAVSLDGLVQRGHAYGIVDEVDSILIDEARTPLIISGEPETAAQLYYDFARIAKQLIPFRASPGDPKGAAEDAGADFEFDEKHKTVGVTPQGVEKVERALRIENLYAPENTQLVNHLYQSLKAESLYHLDIEYVIQDGEVKIVDEFTGRIMEGRRWSEGLHQAIEAKEGVKIQEEHLTLATITLQNYFRLYEKLAGMTGTAKTEEKEFVEIYNLEVVEIPTNVDVARNDENDMVFKTKEGKFAAVARDIEERSGSGQPVLVGTIAVETSEYLSQLLTRKGIKHNVLNAKEHAREAEIIKDAGQKGAVTIATNMAGRGVDIKLGEGVLEAGGLYVLGTERHESRRIDNQLRGRSGRQGDPGETRFYLSGEDDLVRLFAGDRIKGIMERFKIPDDQPMEAKILSRQIEGAQKKVEEQNFVIRKNTLKYDDVLNRHRQRIYEQRRQVLDGDDLSEQVKLWIEEVVEDTVNVFTEEDYPEQWDLEALTQAMAQLYQTEITADELRQDLGEITRETLIEEFQTDACDEYEAKEEEFGADLMRELERFIVLQVVDMRWREHLENMEALREGVHLRSMAQKDPLVEYTADGERMFTELGRIIRGEVVLHLFHAELTPDDAQQQLSPQSQTTNGNLQYEHETSSGAAAMAVAGGGEAVASRRTVVSGRGRSDRAHERAREARPQRPVLVRLGQEVQEVPRRLARV